MSCKLFPPGGARPAPVVWPAARPDSRPEVGRVADGGAADLAVAAAHELAWEEKIETACAAARAEGEAAGRGRAAAELQPILERLGATIADMAGLRARLRREAEADTLELSLAIARRVLRRELSIDAEALHGLVLAALEKIELQEIARVRVHPSQAAAVSNVLRQAGAAVEATPDAALEPGAAIFECARGSFDASVETQLQEIERGLADCLRRQS